MPIAVTCPECQDRYEVPDATADQTIRCRRCQCPIDVKRREEGIQTKPTTVLRKHDDEEFDYPLHHPAPRAPFPLTPMLIVTIGILFFLLAFSVGFNVWFLTRPNK